MARVRFADFELDLETRELCRAGEPVALPAQAAGLLIVLVENAGRLVPRRELIARLWPDRYVDFEQGLHNAVRQLRSALGDDPRSPRYIETVPRQGYRFVAVVTEGGAGASDRTAIAAPRSPRRGWHLGLVLVAMVAVAAGWLLRPPPRVEPGSQRALERGLVEEYLEARYLLEKPNRQAVAEAERRLRAVVAAAPELAEARIALGEALLAAGSADLEELLVVADSALTLAPDVAAAHLLRSRVALTREWDWEAAERHLGRALVLAPRDPRVHLVRAFHAASLGRHEEALAAGALARELDPLSALVQGDLAFLHFLAADWVGVLRESERLLALEPEHGPARSLHLEALLRTERWEEGRAVAMALLGDEGTALATVPGGELHARYLEIQRRRWQAAAPGAVRSMVLASVAAQQGAREEALQHLGDAVERSSAYLPFVPVDPHFGLLARETAWRRLLLAAGHPLASSQAMRLAAR